MGKASAKVEVKAKTKANAKDKARTESKAPADNCSDSADKQQADADRTKPSPEATAKRTRPRPWVLPATEMGKAKVCRAMEQWQGSGRMDDKTMPDQVRTIAPADFAELLRKGGCVPVDVRDMDALLPGESLHGSVSLSYAQLLTGVDSAIAQINKLREDIRPLVVISQEAGRMGVCGLLGAVLVDVFSFDASRVSRLDGGFAGWGPWLDANPSAARGVEPLKARLERKKAQAERKAQADNGAACDKAASCRNNTDAENADPNAVAM